MYAIRAIVLSLTNRISCLRLSFTSRNHVVTIFFCFLFFVPFCFCCFCVPGAAGLFYVLILVREWGGGGVGSGICSIFALYKYARSIQFRRSFILAGRALADIAIGCV